MKNILDELIFQQAQVFLQTAQRVEPKVTLDDLLQPNDFPQLERHPEVRYEEGVLHGLQAAKAALRANRPLA